MEKIIEQTSAIDENEKLIANILHDIKSPLYSIKIGLQNKLDCELHTDIFETIVSVLEYIENFLIDYSFKIGKFKNKISSVDVKNLITKKIENFKYIFIKKNIHIDIIQQQDSFKTEQIEIFLSSIIGNIISNIALHANKNSDAQIILKKDNHNICLEFKNSYNSKNENFNLGLEFCKKLMCKTKVQISFCKTKSECTVKLKIPELNK